MQRGTHNNSNDEIEQAEGIPVQHGPARYAYRLTDKGCDPAPVLSVMFDWGNRYVEGTISREQIDAMMKKGR